MIPAESRVVKRCQLMAGICAGSGGYTQEESNGVISFEDIHYYEKAGEIHYVTDIRGSCSNYGGSITGGNISKLAAAGGGLLFGMLGMAAGALLTYKPAEIKSGGTQFDINSDVKVVVSRCVILKFYSETQIQYLDIELPADIYNFLQTHLPEKKYNIVLELEKRQRFIKLPNRSKAVKFCGLHQIIRRRTMKRTK